MERFTGKVAIVTGSSSGIGAAIAKELVKLGVIVVGLARRKEKLQEIALELSDREQYSGKFYALQCDITKDNEIRTCFKWVFNNLGPVFILINNAGVFEPTLLTDVTSDNIIKTYDTHIKATLLCTKEATKNMIDNSTEGHIVNINSLAGHVLHSFQPNLGMLYTSSKHALRVISEGLRRELSTKKTNIKVTNLSPGLVDTEMTRPLLYVPELHRSVSLQAKDVADACITTLNTPPDVLISELTIIPMHQVI